MVRAPHILFTSGSLLFTPVILTQVARTHQRPALLAFSAASQHFVMETGASTQGEPSRSASNPDCLPIPQIGDSIVVVGRKLIALADAVRRGRSIAVVTHYAASTNQERDPVKVAVADMSPLELSYWRQYAEGTYPLPKIDWDNSCLPAPTAAKPLRTARRRTEALNRLYKTRNADPGHAVWFTKNEALHLPLVKAMARVIGAERNLLGGQSTLSSTRMADLQTINEVLSVSTQIIEGLGCDNAMWREISSAQKILGSHRDMLRELLRGNTKKRKRESE